MSARMTPDRWMGESPWATARNVATASTPDPSGPFGLGPSVLQENDAVPGAAGGGRQTTLRPVLPRNGPTANDSNAVSAGLKFRLNSKAPRFLALSTTMFTTAASPTAVDCETGTTRTMRGPGVGVSVTVGAGVRVCVGVRVMVGVIVIVGVSVIV